MLTRERSHGGWITGGPNFGFYKYFGGGKKKGARVCRQKPTYFRWSGDGLEGKIGTKKGQEWRLGAKALEVGARVYSPYYTLPI